MVNNNIVIRYALKQCEKLEECDNTFVVSIWVENKEKRQYLQSAVLYFQFQDGRIVDITKEMRQKRTNAILKHFEGEICTNIIKANETY